MGGEKSRGQIKDKEKQQKAYLCVEIEKTVELMGCFCQKSWLIKEWIFAIGDIPGYRETFIFNLLKIKAKGF